MRLRNVCLLPAFARFCPLSLASYLGELSFCLLVKTFFLLRSTFFGSTMASSSTRSDLQVHDDSHISPSPNSISMHLAASATNSSNQDIILQDIPSQDGVSQPIEFIEDDHAPSNRTVRYAI